MKYFWLSKFLPFLRFDAFYGHHAGVGNIPARNVKNISGKILGHATNIYYIIILENINLLNVISFNAAKEANKDFRDFDNNRPWWYQRKLAFLFSLVLFGCYSLCVLLFYGFFTHTQTKHMDWPESPMNCTKKPFFDTIGPSFNYDSSYNSTRII